MPSFAFNFHNNGKRKTLCYSFFIFKKELKNELLKQMKISFMITFTSIVYPLFGSKFVSSPLRLSAEQWSCGHQELAI